MELKRDKEILGVISDKKIEEVVEVLIQSIVKPATFKVFISIFDNQPPEYKKSGQKRPKRSEEKKETRKTYTIYKKKA